MGTSSPDSFGEAKQFKFERHVLVWTILVFRGGMVISHRGRKKSKLHNEGINERVAFIEIV